MENYIFIGIGKLKLNDANPRFIKDAQFKKLCSSVACFPRMLQKRPLAVTKAKGDKFHIIGGNMRYRAITEVFSALDTGADAFCKRFKSTAEAFSMLLEYRGKGVPCIDCTDLTEDEQRRFIIADNVSFGDWDMDALANDWDADELKDWGMEVDYDKAEEDAPGDSAIRYQILVECGSEEHRTEVYDMLIARGESAKIK